MPNSKDLHGIQPHKFLMLGPTGSGKTSQLLTLPGKKFSYIFDPNATQSMKGYDIDYEEFLTTPLSLDVRSLTKDKETKEAKGDRVSNSAGSEVYLEWEKDFELKIAKGFFNQYDVIAMDSTTTFLDLIMDRLLTINGRPGQFPLQDDWGPQMVTFTNVMRTLNGLGKMIYCMGHLMTDKDELTGRIVRQPLMTGRLREKIPLLFSDILITSGETNATSGASTYTIQTRSDRQTIARTSIKGLNNIEDVTLDWSKPVDNQGLGGILKWERKQLGL